MSNLLQRLLVAGIGIPIVVYLVMYKPVALLVLIVILALITVHEYYGLAKVKGFTPQIVVGMICTALITLSFAQFRLSTLMTGQNIIHFTIFDLMGVILIFTVIATMTAELFQGVPNPFVNIATTISGAVYIGVGMGAFYGLREFFLVQAAVSQSKVAVDPGLFVVIVLASIWICDSAAYFGGKAMGKHLWYPRVSPNKTWEGAIWGLIFAFVTWFGARALLPGMYALTPAACIAMSLIVGIFGQIGDLAESLLKRDAGVKDSSNLIPGHGGMLDRLDSILFVGPLAYAYLHLFY